MVAIFRDEARFLKEWIEFYKLMGVEHFYLYNHLSTDNYREVLDPYIKDGSVDLYQVTTEPRNLKEWGLLQTHAYSETIQKVKDMVEWLIVVDTDEFLFPVKQTDLKSVLKNYDGYASLSVGWKMFGSGEVERIEDGKLSIESLLLSDDKDDYHVKTIVKPRYVKSISNPHFAELKPGYFQVTENHVVFKGPFAPEPRKNILRINHYWGRDWDFFRTRKLGRIHIVDRNLSEEEKKNKRDSLIETNRDVSVKHDDSILKFAPELRLRMSLGSSS